MEPMNKDARASKILQIMDEVENSPLTINQYFKEKNPPFERAQYWIRYRPNAESPIFILTLFLMIICTKMGSSLLLTHGR